MIPNTKFTTDRRGQAYVTEAIIACLLMSTIMISTTATIGAVDPTISPDDKQKQVEMRADIEGVVETTERNGELKASLLNWNATDRRYNDYDTVQNEKGYYLGYPNDRFGMKLQRIANRYDGAVAVEIIPAANPQDSQSGPLPNTEQEGKTLISGGATSDTVVVEETYMTVYPGDTLQSPPQSHTELQSPAISNQNKTTVYEAYEKADGMESRGEIDEVYFPFVPKTSSYDSIQSDEPWNTYRVRVIGWF